LLGGPLPKVRYIGTKSEIPVIIVDNSG
jgi:hypothetical protein